MRPLPVLLAVFLLAAGAPRAAEPERLIGGQVESLLEFARTRHPEFAALRAEAEAAAARVEPAGAGSLTAADLAGYEVVERPPLCVDYRAHKVCSMGPPSSAGHALGQALHVLAQHDLGASPKAAMAPVPMHLMGEALKLAFRLAAMFGERK